MQQLENNAFFMTGKNQFPEQPKEQFHANSASISNVYSNNMHGSKMQEKVLNFKKLMQVSDSNSQISSPNERNI